MAGSLMDSSVCRRGPIVCSGARGVLSAAVLRCTPVARQSPEVTFNRNGKIQLIHEAHLLINVAKYKHGCADAYIFFFPTSLDCTDDIKLNFKVIQKIIYIHNLLQSCRVHVLQLCLHIA